MAKYGGPVYIQHNPQAADGFDAFIAFVKFYTGQFPQLHVDIKRVIGECNMVVTHSHITTVADATAARRWPTSSASTARARSSSTGT